MLICEDFRTRYNSELYDFRGLAGSVLAFLDVKPGFQPQARHQNEIRKVFFRRYPSSRFLKKNLRVNKIFLKKFLKNLSFVVDFKL